jgi:hypothetical protein
MVIMDCPACHRSISNSAIVDAFNEPAGWLFWGAAGERWIVCKSDSYVHFRVKVNGRDLHRMAIIRSAAQDWIAVQMAAMESNKDKGLIR